MAPWSVRWDRQDGGGESRRVEAVYLVGPNGPQLVSQRPGGRSDVTFDGRRVEFCETDEGIRFTVTSAGGAPSELRALPTDNMDASSCRVVSNIIQVDRSNGFDHQYFTLDGRLLQSLNGRSFDALGSFVSYERTAFDSQEKVRVFLDTSDECREVRQIPLLKGSFDYVANSSARVFECLTQDNRIERYDEGLRLIQSFSPVADLARAYGEGRRIRWDVTGFGDDAWLLSETVWEGASWSSPILSHGTTAFKGDVPLSAADLGLRSAAMAAWGPVKGCLYLMDDSGDYRVRIYDTSFKLLSELDASPFVSPEAQSVSVSVTDPSRYLSSWDAQPPMLSISQQLPPDSSHAETYHQTTTRCLDPAFRLTGFDDFKVVKEGTYAAKGDGKWTFVDEALSPRDAAAYDEVQSLWPYGMKVRQGAQWRLLGDDLGDLLGRPFDSLEVEELAGGLLVQADGSLHLFDPQLDEVDLLGYRPAALDGGSRCYPSARTLPDGRFLVYARDAQGNLGALDDTGRVVIPFAFKGFAESAGTSLSGNIMLQDEEGWFFVAVADLAGSAPGTDCDELGHDYEAVTHAPTCTTDGYVQHVCKRCGHGYRDEGSRVPMLGHDFALVSPATESTCTEEGKGAEYVCSRCQAVKRDASTPSLGGHKWSEWRTVEEATCTKAGAEERSCERCGETDRREVAALGHAWYWLTWAWADDFSAATARTFCLRCDEERELVAEVRHEPAESGMRHSAQVLLDGRKHQDGRLALQWVDSSGVARDLLVKGAPVADGFYVWPDAMEVPAGEEGPVEMDVLPVSEGGVFDALVSKIGSGWPAGTFDVRLSVGGKELHEGFGKLSFAFPAGAENAGKSAVVHHCHKNDRENITSHELRVSEDGMVVLADVEDLSTFALEIKREGAPPAGDGGGTAAPAPTTQAGLKAPSTGSGSSLARTGDGLASGVVALLAVALATGAALGWAVASRKRKARR